MQAAKRSRISRMGIYTYAIIDSNSKISSSINGLGEAVVYNIPYRNIGIVVSESPVRDKTPKVSDGYPRQPVSNGVQDIAQEHILKHEEVVEKLMEDWTVLPMKFHTLFNQEKDVLSVMREYYSDFRENLDRLRNKKEFGVRVIWPGDIKRNRIIDAYKKSNASAAMPNSSSVYPVRDTNLQTEKGKVSNGVKSFVKEKFEEYKIDKEFEEEADKYIALIDNFFSRWACEKKIEKLKSENLLLNAFYLVEKEKEGDFKEAFERARDICICGDLKYLFSGPWPPYNFISLTKKTLHQRLSEADMFGRISPEQNLLNKGIL